MDNELFIYRKAMGSYAVRFHTKDHMIDLFEKHKSDGYNCSGYDWCTLMIAFINEHKSLCILWNEFDYEPTNDDLIIISQNKEALMKLIDAWKKVYYDRNAIENLMANIDYR